MAATRKKLGDLLVEAGAIDAMQLQAALGFQRQWGGKLGAVLVDRGFISEPKLVQTLASQLGVKVVQISKMPIDARALSLVPPAVAATLRVFPLELKGPDKSETLVIAMSDPTDLTAVDQLQFRTRKRIQAVLAGDRDISTAIRRHYHNENVPPPEDSPGVGIRSDLKGGSSDKMPGLVSMDATRKSAAPPPKGLAPAGGPVSMPPPPGYPTRSLRGPTGTPVVVQPVPIPLISRPQPVAPAPPAASFRAGTSEIDPFAELQPEIDVGAEVDDQSWIEPRTGNTSATSLPPEAAAALMEATSLESDGAWAALPEESAASDWDSLAPPEVTGEGPTAAAVAEAPAALESGWGAAEEAPLEAPTEAWEEPLPDLPAPPELTAPAEPESDGAAWADAGESPEIAPEDNAWVEAIAETVSDDAVAEPVAEALAEPVETTEALAPSDEAPVEAAAEEAAVPVDEVPLEAAPAAEEAAESWSTEETAAPVEVADANAWADSPAEVEQPAELEAAPVEPEATPEAEAPGPEQTSTEAELSPASVDPPLEEEAIAATESFETTEIAAAPEADSAADWAEPSESDADDEPAIDVSAAVDEMAEPVEAAAPVEESAEAAPEEAAPEPVAAEAAEESAAIAWADPAPAEPEAPVEAAAPAEPTAEESAAAAWADAAQDAPVEAAQDAPVEAAQDAPVEAAPEAPVEAAAEPSVESDSPAADWAEAAPAVEAAPAAQDPVPSAATNDGIDAAAAWADATEEPVAAPVEAAPTAEESAAASWALSDGVAADAPIETVPAEEPAAVEAPVMEQLPEIPQAPAKRGWEALGIEAPTNENAVQVMGTLLDLLVSRGNLTGAELAAALKEAQERVRE